MGDVTTLLACCGGLIGLWWMEQAELATAVYSRGGHVQVYIVAKLNTRYRSAREEVGALLGPDGAYVKSQVRFSSTPVWSHMDGTS